VPWITSVGSPLSFLSRRKRRSRNDRLNKNAYRQASRKRRRKSLSYSLKSVERVRSRINETGRIEIGVDLRHQVRVAVVVRIVVDQNHLNSGLHDLSHLMSRDQVLNARKKTSMERD